MRWIRQSLLPVGALLILGGCAREVSPPPTAEPQQPPAKARARDEIRLLSPDELTETERKFGVAPRRHESVTYQPDVIIVENGSEVIREMGGDGMTWTLDAQAVAQHDIQPGKVIFLTSRAVGRVLATERKGDALAVILGPVDLGDVIRDCDIHVSQPIDFGKSLTYTLNDMPGGTEEVPPLAREPGEPRLRHAMWRKVQTEEPITHVTGPIASLGWLGVRMDLEKDGVGMHGDMALRLQAPRVEFRLVMDGATVQVAEVMVTGSVGTMISFEGVNQSGRKYNINKREVVPTDISIPIGGALPLTITVRQQFVAQTKFFAPGVLRARADYNFDGLLGVQYHKPYFTFLGPGNFTGRETLMNSIEGVSLGVSALSLTHQVKVIGGFGAFNFVVGPYAFLNSNANVTRHSDMDTLARCRVAGFNLRVGTGVGYVIPQPVTKAINFFLGALNLKPIKGEGGLAGPSKYLVEVVDIQPQSEACTKPSQGSRPAAPAA
jgi:hypothetical protein